MLRIGIDLGGTKIEIIALDDTGRMLARNRIPTPQNDYPATLAAIVDLITRTEHQLGAQGRIGIGTPGAMSLVDGRIKNANSTCLNGQDLTADLTRALGRPVRIANDANCFALSEARDGAGAGAAVVFGVILGTGVGGGIVVGGQLIEGINRIGGEWGHNPLPGEATPGPACYCGRTGCVETYLSGPGMERDHREHGGDARTARDIAQGAADGDPGCLATLDRHEARLARALAVVINILDPDVIVLGGGLSGIGRLYANLPALLKPHVFSDSIATRILPNIHGDSSGVRGAAWLWGR